MKTREPMENVHHVRISKRKIFIDDMEIKGAIACNVNILPEDTTTVTLNIPANITIYD